MGQTIYSLELYDSPRARGRDPLEVFELSSPFQAISVGDLINDQFMREDGAPQDPFLRVVEIVHLIWDAKKNIGPHHKLMVYCQREPAKAG